MKYCDLHCDALTREGVAAVTGERLRAGGCALQCFAAFVSARTGRFASALALADAFDAICAREGLHAVRRFSELEEQSVNALFTVEGGGAAEGDLKKLDALYARGARMMTLLWNEPNELGFPNFPDYGALCAGKGCFTRRETRGLTPFGFEATARMRELGMMIDVSHASDGVFSDVAKESKRTGIPFLASHSGAASAFDCARNLTDGQIRTVAECGGVVGLYFCADFLGGDKTEEGQRAALLAHTRAIVNAGGEEVLALGSDFDGTPENPYLKSPADMPRLIEELIAEFSFSAAEKICCGNFFRVFSAVCL